MNGKSNYGSTKKDDEGLERPWTLTSACLIITVFNLAFFSLSLCCSFIELFLSLFTVAFMGQTTEPNNRKHTDWRHSQTGTVRARPGTERLCGGCSKPPGASLAASKWDVCTEPTDNTQPATVCSPCCCTEGSTAVPPDYRTASFPRLPETPEVILNTKRIVFLV